MKKEEKDKLLKHSAAIEKIRAIIYKSFLEEYEKANKKLMDEYGFAKEELKSSKFEIIITEDNEVKMNWLGNNLPEDSYKIIEKSLVGDDKFLRLLKQTKYEDIGLEIFNFIRKLDPKGKLKRSSSTPNKFINYHITNDKIYNNDNWNFVAITLQDDCLKINVLHSDTKYSLSRVEIYDDNHYPYFKIQDTFQIEDAKKIIEESYLLKHKKIWDL